MIENKQIWDKGIGPAGEMIFNQGSGGSSASAASTTQVPMNTQPTATGQPGQSSTSDWNKYTVKGAKTDFNPGAMSGSTPTNTSAPPASGTPGQIGGPPATPATPAPPVTPAPKQDSPRIQQKKQYIAYLQNNLNMMTIDYQRAVDNGQENDARQIRYRMDQIKKDIMKANYDLSGMS